MARELENYEKKLFILYLSLHLSWNNVFGWQKHFAEIV